MRRPTVLVTVAMRSTVLRWRSFCRRRRSSSSSPVESRIEGQRRESNTTVRLASSSRKPNGKA